MRFAVRRPSDANPALVHTPARHTPDVNPALVHTLTRRTSDVNPALVHTPARRPPGVNPALVHTPTAAHHRQRSHLSHEDLGEVFIASLHDDVCEFPAMTS